MRWLALALCFVLTATQVRGFWVQFALAGKLTKGFPGEPQFLRFPRWDASIRSQELNGRPVGIPFQMTVSFDDTTRRKGIDSLLSGETCSHWELGTKGSETISFGNYSLRLGGLRVMMVKPFRGSHGKIFLDGLGKLPNGDPIRLALTAFVNLPAAPPSLNSFRSLVFSPDSRAFVAVENESGGGAELTSGFFSNLLTDLTSSPKPPPSEDTPRQESAHPVVASFGHNSSTPPVAAAPHPEAPFIGSIVLILAGAEDASESLIVNPNGVPTTVYFEYGLTKDYGLRTPNVDIGNGTSPIDVKSPFVGLEPDTTYHFRLVAIGATAPIYGPDEIFTTLPSGSPSSGP